MTDTGTDGGTGENTGEAQPDAQPETDAGSGEGITSDVSTPRPDEGTAGSVPEGGTPAGGGVEHTAEESNLGTDPGAPSGGTTEE